MANMLVRASPRVSYIFFPKLVCQLPKQIWGSRIISISNSSLFLLQNRGIVVRETCWRRRRRCSLPSAAPPWGLQPVTSTAAGCDLPPPLLEAFDCLIVWFCIFYHWSRTHLWSGSFLLYLVVSSSRPDLRQVLMYCQNRASWPTPSRPIAYACGQSITAYAYACGKSIMAYACGHISARTPAAEKSQPTPAARA